MNSDDFAIFLWAVYESGAKQAAILVVYKSLPSEHTRHRLKSMNRQLCSSFLELKNGIEIQSNSMSIFKKFHKQLWDTLCWF